MPAIGRRKACLALLFTFFAMLAYLETAQFTKAIASFLAILVFVLEGVICLLSALLDKSVEVSDSNSQEDAHRQSASPPDVWQVRSVLERVRRGLRRWRISWLQVWTLML
jgi:hypothetical protein